MTRKKRKHQAEELTNFRSWKLLNEVLGSWKSTDEKRRVEQSSRGIDSTAIAFAEVRERQRQQSLRRVNGL